MKKAYSVLGLVLGAALISPLDASAQTFVTSTTYGGDVYQLYSGNYPWTVAEADAVADGGTLAVLTSAAQTAAVYNNLIGNGFFTANSGQQFEAWLGATPADGSTSTTSRTNWKWVNGATWNSFDVNNFAPGEPNGDSEGLAINRYGNSEWNDEGGYVGGFIVEKPITRNGIGANGVPDGCSTQLLLSGACAVMCAAGRKFRK
jgi:hypothetical protein